MSLRSRFTTGLLLIALLIPFSHTTLAQERDHSEVRASPNAKVSQTIGTTQVDMHYSRPGVKDRDIFGGLVPWGDAWRAGANEPTTITFSDDVRIEGELLESGTYNLFIRPVQEGAWDFIFTTPVDWGTMFDQAEPVLEVSASPEEASFQEWLIYRFENLSDTSADLVMHWEETKASVTIETVN